MPGQSPNEVDVVVVGAGIAGMYMLHKLRQAGLTSRVFEAGDDVGGTWYWNRYPGARVDIDSADYSYSFDPDLQQDWTWSEKFPTQPELLRYLNHVADRFDLRKDITFNTRVNSAVYDEADRRWAVTTATGESVRARHLVMASGCLSDAQVPDIPGRDSFAGATYHTGRWPHDGVDFTGQRVGVIGTGSSGIQSIPLIAQQAQQLYVFQRTAHFTIPARNAPVSAELAAQIKADYPARRDQARLSQAGTIAVRPQKAMAEDTPQQRQAVFEQRWAIGGLGSITGAYNDTGVNLESNEIASEFVRSKIRETVQDPAVAELLCPDTYPIGTKRVCLDTDYYATYNRPNVHLVDIRSGPISEITPTGITAGGEHYELDAIVFATGFDAMTGPLKSMNVRGVGGLSLDEAWADGPRTYLGLMVAGFPNLFTITGPGSPSVLANMIAAIEQHVDWIARAIGQMRGNGQTRIEATTDAQDEWAEEVRRVADGTLFPLANSWYNGDNIAGKPRMFMAYVGGYPDYAARCEEIASAGYTGFALSS